MDIEGVVLSEMSDTGKKTLYVFTYRQNLRNKANEYNKIDMDSDVENKLVITIWER